MGKGKEGIRRWGGEGGGKQKVGDQNQNTPGMKQSDRRGPWDEEEKHTHEMDENGVRRKGGTGWGGNPRERKRQEVRIRAKRRRHRRVRDGRRDQQGNWENWV